MHGIAVNETVHPTECESRFYEMCVLTAIARPSSQGISHTLTRYNGERSAPRHSAINSSSRTAQQLGLGYTEKVGPS